MEVVNAKKRKQLRYGFAISFILIGLIISVGGVFGCFMDKHYEGQIQNFEEQKLIAGSPTSMLCNEYIYNIGNIGSTLYYKFDKHDIGAIEGLSYTIDIKLLWLFVFAGLFYVLLGIYALKNKDFLFK
jgi:hypothetical protein